MANTETTTHAATGGDRTVLLDFNKITLLHPTTNEYVTVTPVELKADATLLAAYLAKQPLVSKNVRRPYDSGLDEFGYLKDGSGNILNKKGNNFKTEWASSKSLPDYEYAKYFAITMLDRGAAS